MSEGQKLADVGASETHEAQPVAGSWTRKSDGAPSACSLAATAR